MSQLISDPGLRARRAEEKIRAALRFLMDETWADTKTMARVIGVKSHQNALKTMRRMEAAGLIRHHPVEILARRIDIWGITPAGHHQGWDLDEAMPANPPTFQPSKLPMNRVTHDLDLKNLRLDMEESGWTQWMPGSRLGWLERGRHRPDAIAHSPDGVPMAIEVERTLKSHKRYRDTLVAHLLERRRGSYQHVVYLAPTEADAQRLKRAINQVETVNTGQREIQLGDSHRAIFTIAHYQDFAIADENHRQALDHIPQKQQEQTQ